MSNIHRREVLKGFLKSLVSVGGMSVLAQAAVALDSVGPKPPDTGKLPTDPSLAERADSLAGDCGCAENGDVQVAKFVNGAFRNVGVGGVGGFRNGAFVNGGGIVGGFRNGGFVNGAWPNYGFANGGFVNGAWRNF